MQLLQPFWRIATRRVFLIFQKLVSFPATQIGEAGVQFCSLEPGLEMLDDEIAVLGDCVVVDLFHDAK